MRSVWYAVWHEGMGFFLAMGLHQFIIAHDLARIPVDDDVSIVYQDDAVAYLQDEFQVMRGN